ncbi:fructosamine kinase family protein [Kaarinaea lacus]
MPDWLSISQHLKDTCGDSLLVDSVRSVGGGCINAAYSLKTDSGQVFIKINSASGLDMFEAEAEGLREISNSHTVRVPKPLCWGTAGSDAYLVMEFLELGSSGNAAQLGEDLAAMHQHVQESHGQENMDRPRFGWFRGNTIGSTTQVNNFEDDWVEFWAKHRLGFQLDLARRNGAESKMLAQGEKLKESLGVFFTDYRPQASLLHGDLWSGNYAFDSSGHPVIFDPAVYYGDREADLAMTELFGGFPMDFYSAYQSVYPLDDGYQTRKTLYNLYHILNHFNIFGGGYLSQASGMINRLLGEIS